MKILIRSRKGVEEMAQKPFPEHTALISITDYDWSFAELEHKPEFLLQLAFDDVDNDVIIDELLHQKRYNDHINKNRRDTYAESFFGCGLQI